MLISVPRRILIATPHTYLESDYSAALRAEGYETGVATNGIECLEQLRRAPPDLVVLDTDILWGGAVGVLAVLADDPAYPAIPAMVVSSRQNRSALYQVGRFIVSDYQLKPLTGRRLVRRLRFLFGSEARAANANRGRPGDKPSPPGEAPSARDETCRPNDAFRTFFSRMSE